MLTRLRLWRCAQVGAGTRLIGRVHVHGKGRVVLGANVLLDARNAPIELHAGRGATIEIGDGAIIEGGASIEAQARVVVGPGARLGPYAKVMDNNFHPVRGDRHHRPISGEVRIDEGAYVGERAILLPGAHLGRGARALAGTVISRRVPPGVTMSGFPAKALKSAGAVNGAGSNPASDPSSAPTQIPPPGSVTPGGYTPVPGSLAIPGATPVPGSLLPGYTPVPGSIAIPGATPVPGSLMLAGATPAPGATPVPGSYPPMGSGAFTPLPLPESSEWTDVRVRGTLRHKVRRVMTRLRARFYLRACQLGRAVGAGGPVAVSVRGKAEIGDRATFLGGIVPTCLRVAAGAVLSVGSECVFNYGVTIDSRAGITFGRRCMVASFVRLVDSVDGKTAPIVVGNDVWIAHGAVIEPGVTLGDGVVVAAGSVVNRDVPAGSMAMGNPARAVSLTLSRG